MNQTGITPFEAGIAIPMWLSLILVVLIHRRRFYGPSHLESFSHAVLLMIWVLLVNCLAWLGFVQIGLSHRLSAWVGLIALCFIYIIKTKRAKTNPLLCFPPQDWKLIIGLAIVAFVPNLVYLGYNGFSAYPDYYFSADIPWQFSHAQAYLSHPIPIDLSYLGAVVHYHTGYSLMAAIISKTTGLPIGISYFVFGPFLIRFGMIVALLLAFGKFKDGALVNRKGFVWTMLIFVFFIHLNFVELVHSIFYRDELLSYDAFVGGPGLYMQTMFAGTNELAFCLMACFLGLLKRRAYGQSALMMAFVSFAKPTLFLPLAFVYAVIAIRWIWSRRDIVPFLWGGYALGLVLLILSFGSASIAGVSMGMPRLGHWGYNWLWIFESPVTELWKSLGWIDSGWTGFLGSLLSRVLRYASFYMPFLPLCIIVVMKWRVCKIFIYSQVAVIIPLGVMLLSYAMSGWSWMYVTESVEKYYAIVKNHRLEVEYHAAIQINNRLNGNMCLLLFAFGLGSSLFTRLGPKLRKIYVLLAISMPVFFASHLLQGNKKMPEFMDVRELKSIFEYAEGDGLFFTNKKSLGDSRPFRNVLYPGVAGRQFFASNFEYGNIYSDENVKRFNEVNEFWKNTFDKKSYEYLLKHNIRYVLVSYDSPNSISPEMQKTYFRLLKESQNFRLLEVMKPSNEG